MKELKTFLQEDGTYRYSIMAPDFVVDREDRPHYEKDRFASMEANLKPGDVLFDIGSELGWQSAIYAKFVGPENMCLFEPHKELWPTIEHTWALNLYPPPKAAVQAFVSNRSVGEPSLVAWPELGVPLRDFSTWEAIHRNPDAPEITIDDFVERTGIVPTALTIDVEGAELRVLQGATYTVRKYRPLIWLSVHPIERMKAFKASKHDVLGEFMREFGYSVQYLGVDHEEHYFCFPTERLVDRGDLIFVDSPWMTNGKRNKTFEEAIPYWTDDMGMPYTGAWGQS